MPRLKDRYAKEVVPSLMNSFGYRNVMQAPRLSKVVVSMGVGQAVQDAKLLDNAVNARKEIRVELQGAPGNADRVHGDPEGSDDV